jgi:hypothetical protein
MEFAPQTPGVVVVVVPVVAVVPVGTHRPLVESNVKPEGHIELVPVVPNPLVVVVVVVVLALQVTMV